MIHVALSSAYPTEADARATLNQADTDMAYRGLWVVPTPESPVVHVFTDLSAEEMERLGWIKETP